MSAPAVLSIDIAHIVAYPPLPAGTWEGVPTLLPGWALVCIDRGGHVYGVPDRATFDTVRGACVVYAVPPWVVAPKEQQP